MSNMNDDKDLVEDALCFLNDLRAAGVFEIAEMAAMLQAIFFMPQWEAFIILQEWIRCYYIEPKRGQDD